MCKICLSGGAAAGFFGGGVVLPPPQATIKRESMPRILNRLAKLNIFLSCIRSISFVTKNSSIIKRCDNHRNRVSVQSGDSMVLNLLGDTFVALNLLGNTLDEGTFSGAVLFQDMK